MFDPDRATPKQKVLYRSDTKAPLSVVSSRYQVVQPEEILEFYRDLTEVSGFELESAGVLKDGKQLWALTRTGQSVPLKGHDRVNGYLLLATRTTAHRQRPRSSRRCASSATTRSPLRWATARAQSRSRTAANSTRGL